MPATPISLKSWLVLISVAILVFLVNIDYTAVNLTLLPISEEIEASLNDLQWLLSGYVLIWSACVVLAGRVADIYGKRNTLIVGLVIFMGGSSLAGFAHTLPLLIGGRILQGLGAALFSAPAWAFIFELAPPQRQGFVMGIITSFGGFGLAVGPTLGGLIIEVMSWRWIFYVNLPLGILIIAILLLYAPKETLQKTREKINWIQAFLLSTALCTSIYILNQIDSLDFQGSLALLPLILWGAYFLSFVFLRQKNAAKKAKSFALLAKLGAYETLIPFALFRNKPFVILTLSVTATAMIFSMTLVLIGLYLQNTLHYSTYETGLIFIAMTITMGLLSPIGGKMIDLFGAKHLLLFGAVTTTLATLMMIFLNTDSSLLYILCCLFLVGSGLGLYFTAGNTAMLQAAPQKDLAVASGVYMMFMMLGNTLSVVLAANTTVIFGRTHLFENLQGAALSPEQFHEVVEIIGKVEHSASQLIHFSQDLVPHLLHAIDAAFVYGLKLNMIGGTLLGLSVVLLTAWGIKRDPAR